TVTRRAYDPYGAPRGTTPANWIDNHGYLGKPVDAASGLDLLGARNYDPALGRFLSVDPVLEVGDPNQMGGYTYAGNDPVNGSDPTGLMRDGGGDCGAIHTCNTDPPPATSGTSSSTPTPTPSPGPPPPGTPPENPGQGDHPRSGVLLDLLGGIGQGVSKTYRKLEDISCYFGSDDHNCHRDRPFEGPMIERAAPSEIAKQMFGTDDPALNHNSLPFKVGEVLGEAAALPVPSPAGAAEEAVASVALRAGIKSGEKAASEAAAGVGARAFGRGMGPAGARVVGGHAAGETVFAGHGAWNIWNGWTKIPEGTQLAMYTPHGTELGDREGFMIEAGTPMSPPFRIYGAGERIRNYTLSPANDLTVLRGSTTVTRNHTLSTLLQPNAGMCHWAACT
ncbi:RHS repeat-associated core domain-containing protein, partial [Streptomyces sp. NPDC020719]|uniref:RHS repeat-associated core domain-containing protein n=1 Tax=Streptomyces sp. NPDC020719 TaxID=3154896 RepID=UPI0033FBBB58